MTPVKQFRVFGEAVEILVSSEATAGSFCMVTQVSPPGGGPPPHSHRKEDEIFMVLDGEYEFFDGSTWSRMPNREHVYTLRDGVHTFRNCGTSDGKMLCIATPGGLDKYLEAISPLAMPQDMGPLMEISEAYGIAYASPEPPAAPPL